MKRYALAIVVVALVVVFARNSFVHCDTIDEPVVMDAQAALKKVESIHTAQDADGEHREKHGTTAGHEGHRDAETPRAHPAAGVNNIFENIPYQEQGMGTRKLVDNKHVMMMQIALKPGQSVPQHAANSNVNLLVVKGEVVINLNGVEHIAGEGSLVPVAYKTPMSITNRSHSDATFLNIKTPSPSEMK